MGNYQLSTWYLPLKTYDYWLLSIIGYLYRLKEIHLK